MESVPGLPFNEYGDQCKLTTRQRLQLFVAGVQRYSACAPEGDHSSRFEADQYPDHAGGFDPDAEGHRFWHRQSH